MTMERITSSVKCIAGKMRNRQTIRQIFDEMEVLTPADS